MRHASLQKICLVAIAILCCCFSLAVYSQNPEDKTKIDRRKEKEQKEIEQFADEFIKNLEMTFDLDQMSERFFESGFRQRLSKNDTWDISSGKEDLGNRFGDDERLRNNVSWINFFNLLDMFFCENPNANEDCDGSLKKNLPPHIVELFTRSKWLRDFIEDEDDNSKAPPAPATLTDYRSLLADLNTASEAMRAEVKRRKLKFSKGPNLNEYLPPEECKGVRCNGLPEKTVIFSMHKFFMCLRIVRANNELKIVNINNAALEN